MKTNLMKSVLMFMALGAVVFTSCTKNELETEGNDPAAVSFTSAIAAPTPMTKASGESWAAGDKVGIFMVATTTTDIAEGASNRLYTTAAANTFTTDAPIYYPVDGSSVDFIAYYPYRESQTLSATYLVNVASQTSQADIDLLYSNDATAKTKANTNVAMTFDHKLSKVIINTTAGDGLSETDLADMTVKIIGMQTKSDFDLTFGTLGTYSAPHDIAAFVATPGKKYEAIVLPATFAAGALTMEFALNNDPKNEVFKRTNTDEEVFEAGRVYTYNVNVKRTGVTFTCTITDWKAGPVRNIDAE